MVYDKSNTIRVYVVDVKNDIVKYFNSSALRIKQTSSVTAFYSQFSSKDRQALISWIGDLLDKDVETNKFFEEKIYIKRKKKTYSSILSATKIDFEKQLNIAEKLKMVVGQNSDSNQKAV